MSVKSNSENSAIAGVKIAIVTSIPFVLVTNLKQQIKYLHSARMDITLISSEGPQLSQLELGPNLRHIVVGIEREPSPVKDLIALLRLMRIFWKHKYKIVHSTTPKAGLLAAIAGKLAGINIRLHTYTGQRWVTMQGIKKQIVKNSDRVIAMLNTKCYADSKSQAEFLKAEKIISKNKIDVLGAGSLAGVEASHFNRDCINKEQKDELKKKLGLDANSIVVLFIGRINRDKGILELMSAFNSLRKKSVNFELLMVGPMEASEDIAIREAVKPKKGLHLLGYQDDPESYMAISDILCLPSYREGFGTVVIETAAMGIPTIGTRIPGLVDAVVDGETGLLVTRGNSCELEDALKKLIHDEKFRNELGEKAKKRCLKEFDATVINSLLVEEYVSFLNS